MGTMHGKTMQPTNVLQPNILANRFAPLRSIYPSFASFQFLPVASFLVSILAAYCSPHEVGC